MNELDNTICQECGSTLSPTGKCLFCNSRNEKKFVVREHPVYRPTQLGAITVYIWIMSILYVIAGIGIFFLLSVGLPPIFIILVLVSFGLNLKVIDIISSIFTGFGFLRLVRNVLTFVIFVKNWDWFE